MFRRFFRFAQNDRTQGWFRKAALCASLFVALFFSLPVQGAFAQNAPSGVQHQLFSLKLVAGVGQKVPTPFSFQAFAMSQAEGLEVRFSNGKQWTAWTELHREEPELMASELYFLSSSRSFEIRSQKDQEITATILQLREQPVQVVQSAQLVLDAGAALEPSFRIISRKEWGADEELGTYVPKEVSAATNGHGDERDDVNICSPIEKAYPGQYQVSDKEVSFDELGRPLIWPRQYSNKIKKIVIHHTAQTLKDLNEDGKIDRRDYSLGVKAIYVYHTLSRKWGDLGYHYLVDPDGRVYEGRAGGAEVIAAHVLCQNSNTIGISVMGNFEESKLSEKAFEGLVNITHYLTSLYDVNPLGKSSFRGTVLPNIVTHAEVGEVTKQYIGQGATACPGEDLKLAMVSLRKIVAAGGIRPDLAYDVEDLLKTLKVDPLQHIEVKVQLKNTGVQTWSSVKVYSGKKKEPLLVLSSSVGSDQVLELRIPYETDLEAGRKDDRLTIELNGTKMKKTFLVSYLVNKPVYRYDLISFSGDEKPLLVGETRMIQMKLKNTGNFPWLVEGKNSFQIREVRKRGAQVVALPSGMQLFLSQSVPVGGFADFSFELPLQRRAGEIRKEFLPMIGKDKGLKGDRLAVALEAEMPKFVAEVRPVERRAVVQKGFEEEVQFQVRNTGNFDWDASSVWVQMKGGEKEVIGPMIGRGETYEFPVTVRAGYDEKSVAVSGTVGLDELPSFLELKNFRRGRVAFDQALSARGTVKLMAKVVNDMGELPAEKGTHEIQVLLENTGNVPWYSEGADRMILEVSDKADFVHRSWRQRKIAAVLSESVVMPGEIGAFAMTAEVKVVPRRTTFDEFVVKAGEREVKLRGRLKIGITVKGTREKKETPVSEEKATSLPPMRVLLTGVNQAELQITSPGKFVVWDSASVELRTFDAGQVFTVREADVKNGTVYRIRAQDSHSLELKNWGVAKTFGTQKYLDNQFRNVIEVRADEGKMVVINELLLEDYMKGIAEVPETDDQPMEKRKVIAVLSRSYALHYLVSGYEKFPGKPYNAADSPAIFQKYLGYGFEQRAPKWQEALKETQGEVVMEGESVLRAAYFSCTDGDRTKTPEEAGWGGNEYFKKFGSVFQSVADPLGDDPTRQGSTACGHQVGLSGYGATQMAKEGKNYREIIDHYYREIEVEKW